LFSKTRRSDAFGTKNEWWFVLEDMVFALTDSRTQRVHTEDETRVNPVLARVGTNCTYPSCRDRRRESEHDLR